MESSTVDQSRRQHSHAEVSDRAAIGPRLESSGPARRRGIVLARMLFLGDMVAALSPASSSSSFSAPPSRTR